MLRLFLFVLLIFLFLWVIKNYLSHARNHRRAEPADDDMALDPQCQSYIPKREAVEIGGNFFCSRECAERYLGR